MNLRRLHFISGIIVAIFIFLHLFNHFYSIFGIEQHIDLMNFLRPIYRNTFAETILLFAVFTQIISGLLLFKKIRKQQNSKFQKLGIYSGLYLAIFLVIHLMAVFTVRHFLKLDTNFYFGVAGLNVFPFTLFFIPYYGLGIMAIFGHIASAHRNLQKRDLFGLTPCRQAKLILIIGFCLTIVIFYGLTNHFHGVTLPTKYNILIGK